jgi:hypothetical protein
MRWQWKTPAENYRRACTSIEINVQSPPVYVTELYSFRGHDDTAAIHWAAASTHTRGNTRQNVWTICTPIEPIPLYVCKEKTDATVISESLCVSTNRQRCLTMYKYQEESKNPRVLDQCSRTLWLCGRWRHMHTVYEYRQGDEMVCVRYFSVCVWRYKLEGKFHIRKKLIT